MKPWQELLLVIIAIVLIIVVFSKGVDAIKSSGGFDHFIETIYLNRKS